MKDNGILKTVKLSYVIISALECVLGLVMLFYPGFSLSAMGVILGVGLGVYSMFYYIIKTAKHVDPTQPGEEDDRGRKNQ